MKLILWRVKLKSCLSTCTYEIEKAVLLSWRMWSSSLLGHGRRRLGLCNIISNRYGLTGVIWYRCRYSQWCWGLHSLPHISISIGCIWTTVATNHNEAPSLQPCGGQNRSWQRISKISCLVMYVKCYLVDGAKRQWNDSPL